MTSVTVPRSREDAPWRKVCHSPERTKSSFNEEMVPSMFFKSCSTLRRGLSLNRRSWSLGPGARSMASMIALTERTTLRWMTDRHDERSRAHCSVANWMRKSDRGQRGDEEGVWDGLLRAVDLPVGGVSERGGRGRDTCRSRSGRGGES